MVVGSEGGSGEGAYTGGRGVPPLQRAAAAAAPKSAATVGITIAQIAPADKPLLDFLARYYH